MADVLVVDDDRTVREVVVSYLRASGHEVTEAARRGGGADRHATGTGPTSWCST